MMLHLGGRPLGFIALLLFSLLLLSACGPTERVREPAHGLILIVLDTVRADRLGAYGHSVDTSPELDRLAEEGVLFEHAVSHASWTLPAAIGLFTGHYPSARTYRDGRLQVSAVEGLRARGYRTAAFTEGAFFSAHFGFDRGFDLYSEEEGATRLLVRKEVREGTAPGEGEGGIERTFAQASEWLAENGEHPFFLLLHTYEAHTPYRRRDFASGSPPGFGETFEQEDVVRLRGRSLVPDEAGIDYVRALYDGGIRAADAHVGQLRRRLAELGLADRTVLAMTADHGEDLGERQVHALGQHGHTLHRPLTHIPLIVFDPRQPWTGRKVEAQVRLIDVMPTLLELAGTEPLEGTTGRSLVALMERSERESRLAFGEVSHRETGRNLQSAISDGEYKLIVRPRATPARRLGGGPRREMYRISVDPEERNDLSGSDRANLARLAAELRRHQKAIQVEGAVATGGGDMPAELRERLEALGYVE